MGLDQDGKYCFLTRFLYSYCVSSTLAGDHEWAMFGPLVVSAEPGAAVEIGSYSSSLLLC